VNAPRPRLFIGGREIAIHDATWSIDYGDVAEEMRAKVHGALSSAGVDADAIVGFMVPTTMAVHIERVCTPEDDAAWTAMVRALLGSPRRQRRALARIGTVGRRGAVRVACEETIG